MTVEQDYQVECFIGGGPGGQHRNKTMTTVRVTHLPTKISAVSNLRSQLQNKKLAYAAVNEKLKKIHSQQLAASESSSRLTQVGYITRGTRIRTYNFIEDRVTDERVNKQFSAKEIMKGRLDLIYRC